MINILLSTYYILIQCSLAWKKIGLKRKGCDKAIRVSRLRRFKRFYVNVETGRNIILEEPHISRGVRGLVGEGNWKCVEVRVVVGKWWW